MRAYSGLWVAVVLAVLAAPPLGAQPITTAGDFSVEPPTLLSLRRLKTTRREPQPPADRPHALRSSSRRGRAFTGLRAVWVATIATTCRRVRRGTSSVHKK